MFLVGTCAGVLFGKKKHHSGSNTANQGPRGALWGALWYNNEEGARSEVALRSCGVGKSEYEFCCPLRFFGGGCYGGCAAGEFGP